MISASSTQVGLVAIRAHSRRVARWSSVSLAATILALVALLVLVSLALWRPHAHGLPLDDGRGIERL